MLTSGGNLTLAGTTTFGGIAYTWPSAGQSSGYALTTNGSGTLSWSAGSGLGTNYWSLANGSLYPVNATVDLLVGGTATTSAKFAFLNVASGTPTASISGTTTNVTTYITGNGNLATTNMAPFTLGGAATGNISLAAGSATPAFVVTTAGQVGIGTTSPISKLHVEGQCVAIGTKIRRRKRAKSRKQKSKNERRKRPGTGFSFARGGLAKLGRHPGGGH